MIKYPLEKVIGVLREVSKKFILTEKIELKKIKFSKSKQYYLVTLRDDSQHIIPQEIINTYIENFGEKGGLEIAGHLRHDVELEQSAFDASAASNEDYWDGNINDVIDYLNEKKEDGYTFPF